MSKDPRITPTLVKAPHGATEMQISWADGHRSVVPHDILRGFCPCAVCQGHGGAIKRVQGGSLELRDLERVGNYALTFTWADAHATGIYSFKYLRALCQCPECKPNFHLGEEP